MKEIKAVIFDLDDTLYPEIEYVKSGFKVVSQYLSSKINIESIEIYEKLLELFREDKSNVFDRFVSLNNIEDKNLVIECVSIYRNHLPNISLSHEVKELLKWLLANEFKIGIITDGRPEGQWNKIKALKLEDYCNAIIVTDELGGIEFRKPSKVPYIRMLKALDVQPEESVYIGDNPAKDFITANKLGIFTIMLEKNDSIYKNENIEAEYLAKVRVNKISEIKNYLKDKY